jgi:hypothetical protein
MSSRKMLGHVAANTQNSVPAKADEQVRHSMMLNARQSDVFMDVETERYILRAIRAREHVFEMDGELVTSIDRSNNAHLQRLKNGRIRAVTDEEFAKFQELFSNE